ESVLSCPHPRPAPPLCRPDRAMLRAAALSRRTLHSRSVPSHTARDVSSASLNSSLGEGRFSLPPHVRRVIRPIVEARIEPQVGWEIDAVSTSGVGHPLVPVRRLHT